MRRAIDDAEDKLAWRGNVMEHCLTDAIQDIIPEGVVTSHMQPGCERVPLDHVERCRKNKEDLLGAERADISIETTGGRRKVLDMGTTNVVSRSALQSNVETHMERIVDAKMKRYKDYYRNFSPFIMRLSGGVTESSWAAIKTICCWVTLLDLA